MRRRRLALAVLTGFGLASALTLWGAATIRWNAALLLVSALGLSRLGALTERSFEGVVGVAALVFLLAAAVAGARGLQKLVRRGRDARSGRPGLWPSVSIGVTTAAAVAVAGALVGEVSRPMAAGVLLGAAAWLSLAGPLLALRSGFRVAGRAIAWGAWSSLSAGLVGVGAGLLALSAWTLLPWTLDTVGAGLRIGGWVASPVQQTPDATTLRGVLARVALVSERGVVSARPTDRTPLLARLDRAAQLPPSVAEATPPLSEGELAARVGRVRHHRFEACMARLRGPDDDLYEDARTWLLDGLGEGEAPDGVLFESVFRVCLRAAADEGLDPRGLFLEAVANTREDREGPQAGFPACEGVQERTGCWQPAGGQDLRGPEERALVRWAWCQAPVEARRALELHLEEGRSFEDLALRLGRDSGSAEALYYQGLELIRSRWTEAACLGVSTR